MIFQQPYLVRAVRRSGGLEVAYADLPLVGRVGRRVGDAAPRHGRRRLLRLDVVAHRHLQVCDRRGEILLYLWPTLAGALLLFLRGETGVSRIVIGRSLHRLSHLGAQRPIFRLSADFMGMTISEHLPFKANADCHVQTKVV